MTTKRWDHGCLHALPNARASSQKTCSDGAPTSVDAWASHRTPIKVTSETRAIFHAPARVPDDPRSARIGHQLDSRRAEQWASRPSARKITTELKSRPINRIELVQAQQYFIPVVAVDSQILEDASRRAYVLRRLCTQPCEQCLDELKGGRSGAIRTCSVRLANDRVSAAAARSLAGRRRPQALIRRHSDAG